MQNLNEGNNKQMSRIEEKYSRQERVLYFIKRHLIFLAIFVPCILFLQSQEFVVQETGEVIDPGNGLLMMQVSSILDAAITVWTSLLILKFAMPKMHIQKEIIEDQNSAVAILCAAVILGMALA